MSIFLDAALKTLIKADRPLSATQLTNMAEDLGHLRSTGLTPSQTMKSKLSTDILAKGSRSLFMRTDRGLFALRSWHDRHAEFTADRYQRALFDEDIIVFPQNILGGYVAGPGLHTTPIDHDGLLRSCYSMRRREAEDDTDVIQVVSVFVLVHEHRYLTYKRTKRLPESRLHGYYSIAFGGHLNPDDVRPLLNIFDPRIGFPLLYRELSEEVRLADDSISRIDYWGLLYDDSKPVSRQHLGIAYRVHLRDTRYEIGERGFLMDSKFETLAEITARADDFENWSRILLREEIARCQT